MLSLRLGEKAEAIRSELQTWLRSNKPPQISGKIELEQFVELSTAWQQKLAADNWVGVHWPEAYGGRGLTIVEEAVVQEVLAEARAPQLINLFGLTMVGPVLIEHGTDAQKERFLSKILSAEEIWCQGFSEPDAGSDLASLRTTATPDPQDSEQWVLNGQKVWTSFAHVADWCFVLARTDSDVPKHKGISYFLLPMSSEGITVRPLTQISGDKEFNEIFLENVPVAAENLVGKPGDGWKMAISTLMYERVVLTFTRHLQSEVLLAEIGELLDGASTEADRVRYGELVAESMAVRALAMNHLLTYGKTNPPGPEGSLDKLGWSETFQSICQFGFELLGPDGLITDGADAHKDGLFQHQYLYSRGRTIAAGTSEIQRSIIAERVMGLPRGR